MTTGHHGANAPQPGWYADPWAVAQFRWHDGVQWTAHVHPPVGDTPTAPAAHAAPAAPAAPTAVATPETPSSRHAHEPYIILGLVAGSWAMSLAARFLYHSRPLEGIGHSLSRFFLIGVIFVIVQLVRRKIPATPLTIGATVLALLGASVLPAIVPVSKATTSGTTTTAASLPAAKDVRELPTTNDDAATTEPTAAEIEAATAVIDAALFTSKQNALVAKSNRVMTQLEASIKRLTAGQFTTTKRNELLKVLRTSQRQLGLIHRQSLAVKPPAGDPKLRRLDALADASSAASLSCIKAVRADLNNGTNRYGSVCAKSDAAVQRYNAYAATI